MEAVPPSPTGEGLATGLPQNALLDFFFPGFSVVLGAVSRYLHIDLNLYIPLVLLFGALTFAWRYFSEFFTSLIETHLMSVVDIRAADEVYNYVLGWVANQRFSKTARRFVVNTNLNSRSWYLWRWDEDEEQDEDGEVEDGSSVRRQKKKVLAYTPNFGSHWFLYKGRILVFRRLQNQQQSGWLTKSEREEISISCFGRNPWVLEELLHEAREEYMKRDEAKTLIYRGTTKSGSSEPQWQRCLARTSRPLSTVILNSDVKQKLIDDATDYLNPSTRRWYANRGIPYRRGYLLYGPPGTGKSSLSLALAGFFKMRIYIVSLNSVTANEENLASLFAELPRRCVVLLEDIDTAGLTHTREDGTQANDSATSDTAAHDAATQSDSRPGPQPANPNATGPAGRLSLSGLLNLLDGVCSQEGRLLVMTTNHLEKLDKALIRPGRVDMIVKFDLADAEMTAAIFRAIYAPLEGDDAPSSSKTDSAAGASTSRALFQLESALKSATNSAAPLLSPEEDKKQQAALAEAARKKAETLAQVDAQAERFAARIPAHEFSPAELQGYLLKNKRDPEGAVEGAEQWVVSTRKEKKEKELKEAQEKREKEEKERKEKEKEMKEKEEKDKEAKKKEKEKKEATKKAGSSKKKASAAAKKKKASKKSKSDSEVESGSSSSSASSSSDEADSASESEKEKEEKTKKKTPKKKASSKPVANSGVPAPGAAVDAPVQPNGTEKVEEDSSALSESKGAEQPAIVIPPPIKVDTDLTLKGTGLEAQRTPAADSGYGTP